MVEGGFLPSLPIGFLTWKRLSFCESSSKRQASRSGLVLSSSFVREQLYTKAEAGTHITRHSSQCTSDHLKTQARSEEAQLCPHQ